ncbi:MAG: peptidoglycan DD-metalloendopeptidase family protein [Patescibacteria group bacterium]
MRTLVLTTALIVLCLYTVAMGYPSLKLPVVDDQVLKCDQHYNECAPTHCPNVTYNLAWDFNLNGFGGDADLGYPVVACADGRVVYAQNYSPGVDGWGNCVVIDYDNDASNHQGLYGHLEQIFVKVGENVKSGQVIGAIGKGDGNYSAHLHYQVQSGSTPDAQSVSASFADAGVPTFPNTYTSQNSRTIDLEQSAQGGAIGNKNGAVVWWYGWDAGNRYDGSNCARRCYKQAYTGGTYGSCAIVYDGLGGARKAYTVRTGFWNNGQGNGWSQLSPAGPQSSLGMPITNEYANGSGARQDFQKGYLYYNGSTVSVNSYPNDAPGWTSSGWNNQYSYLFARAYERNGARNTLGEATGVVYSWNNFRRQNFSAGKCIMYDPNNAADNPLATNEAYYLAGNFYTVYFTEYPSAWQTIGQPTRDREGSTQYFKTGRMVEEANGVIRVYNASNQQVWTNYVSGSGGSSTPLTYMTGPAPAGDIAAMISSRMTAPLNNKNPYGFWQTPQQVSGGFNVTYWWYDYPSTPAYQGDNTSQNCYVATATGQPGAVVHDVYGAARQSFYVGWWPWDNWKGMGLNCGNCPNPAGTQVTGQGGSYSCLGMPITNLYRPTPSENYGRQDFQRGYIINGVIYCYDHITAFTPGWTINGWNNVWSYIITDCYDRYGAAAGLGHATQLVNTNWDGTGYFIQPYDGGTYGPIMLVYNPNGPSEAYGVSGSFLYAYTMGLDGSGVRLSTRIGSPTEAFSGNRQQFQYGYMTINYGTNVTYVYLNDNTEIWNSQTGAHLGKVAQTTLPTVFALNQNYPNPFNPATTIAYSLPSATHVTLDIYNVLGQRVTTLVDEQQAAGEHTATWDANPFSSGVYFYRIQTEEATETKKMLLLK